MIRMVDLVPRGELTTELEAAHVRVVKRGRFILGEQVEAFEAEWAAYCGVAYCVACGNGFDALRLALKAHNRDDSDVLVPGNTCLPTVLAPSMPFPMEPDLRTYQMDVDYLDAHVDDPMWPAHAIIPVHLYGIPANIDAINRIARRYGLVVIEDCAQAHGAEYLGRRIGGHGNTCAWSFYPTKNLGALGDAGAVTTDNAAIADRVRALRSYGCEGAINSRMDELQAAFLRAKLPYLDGWNETRRRNAALYLRELRDVPGVTLPVIPDYANPCWHQFVIRHTKRNALRVHLLERGIETQVHYDPPPHKALGYNVDLPITEMLSREVVSLPVAPHVTQEMVMDVVRGIKEFG